MLEAAEAIGTGTSSRNSEVIHAGIYYPRDSLMARLCVRGGGCCTSSAPSAGVPFRNCGKLIVATSDEEDDAAGRHQGAGRGQRRRGYAAADGGRGAGAGAGTCPARRRCCRRRPASSTATPTCWRCRARPRRPARCSCSTRRSKAALRWPRRASNSRSAAPSRCAALPHCWSTRPGCRRRRLARRIAGMPAELVPQAVLRQGQLLHPDRPLAVLPADLSGAGAGRAGRASDHRPGRAGAVRPRRGMGGPRSTTRSIRRGPTFLRRGAALLAGLAGRRVAAGLFRHPAEDRAAGGAGAGFRGPGAGAHGVAGLVNLFGIESPGLTAAIALAELVATELPSAPGC